MEKWWPSILNLIQIMSSFVLKSSNFCIKKRRYFNEKIIYAVFYIWHPLLSLYYIHTWMLNDNHSTSIIQSMNKIFLKPSFNRSNKRIYSVKESFQPLIKGMCVFIIGDIGSIGSVKGRKKKRKESLYSGRS